MNSDILLTLKFDDGEGVQVPINLQFNGKEKNLTSLYVSTKSPLGEGKLERFDYGFGFESTPGGEERQ